MSSDFYRERRRHRGQPPNLFYWNMDIRSRLVVPFLILVLLPDAWATTLHLSGWQENLIPRTGGENQVDPDTYLNISELITSKGYSVEEYEVTTSDGYILGIQRIPSGRSSNQSHQEKKPVVLLHHGLLSAGHDWVINLPNQSLGFILADAGYDVWIGNARGNTYSRKHSTLSPRSNAFWKFTWDDMALTDLPAVIDFVLTTTNQSQLSYVGHSMGTSIIFALLSEKPEYNAKVRAAVALGPVATVSYMTSPVRYLAPFSGDLEFLLNIFGHGEFLPSDLFVKMLSQVVCKTARPVCDNILFLFCGIESKQLNETRLPVYLAHTPSGTSTITVIHYAQMINTKTFQKFDWGRKENLKKYGQPTPPLYPVENITSPVALMWGLNDPLADPTDVNLLAQNLKSLTLNYQVPYPAWTHLDFVYGLDANVYLYPKVLKFLNTV